MVLKKDTEIRAPHERRDIEDNAMIIFLISQ